MADPRGEPWALGEDWWVLDNALRLYRVLGKKKGREALLLRELKVGYSGFPLGSVFARETPDFLVKHPDGRRVGLELVEVHRGNQRKKGSRHREREGSEEAVLRLAEDTYYADDPTGPVRALLSWPPHPEAGRVGPLPRPTGELAGEVARLVRKGAPTWAGGARLELGPKGLEGTPLEDVLHGLSARQTGYVGEDGRDSLWGRALSYEPETALVADVAREVDKKDRVYGACRERCEEAWLVVVLGGGPSSFEDADDAMLGQPFRSAFDRLLLVCPGSRRGTRAVALSVTG